MPGDGAETVELLARRAPLLRALRDGPIQKRDLVTDLSISRSTVDRAVRNLETREFVQRDDEISLTLMGRLAIDAYDEFVGYVDALESARPVLRSLPVDATIDRRFVEGANVVSADRLSPERHAMAFMEELETATDIRGYSSALMPSYVDLLHERIVDDGLTLELTLSPALFDELLSAAGDRVNEVLSTGRFQLFEATTSLDYSLFVIEQPERTLAAALVYDDRGQSGVLFNDDPAAVEWAERVYERIRESASPMPLQ
jgi:predicted transcriptional regulator